MKVTISNSNFSQIATCPSGCLIVVQDAINLNGCTLTFPSKVSLLFENGAKFTNGKIVLDDTYVHDAMQVLFENITFDNKFRGEGAQRRNLSSFTNDIIRPEWFSTTTSLDDTQTLQQAIDLASHAGNIIQLMPRNYVISETLKVFSSTVINGTIQGAFDRSVWCGSTIVSKIDADEAPAFEFYCEDDNKHPFNEQYRTTCYKFHLSNFYLVNTLSSTINSIGIRFHADESYVIPKPAPEEDVKVNISSPRNGIIENIAIKGFGIGLKITGISYVEFNNIYISEFNQGVYIGKEFDNSLVEFAWFNGLSLNNSVKKNDSIGLQIEGGALLYFENIKFNNLNIGISLCSAYELYAQFFKGLAITNCTIGFFMRAINNGINRITMSDATLFNYTYGIYLTRENKGVVSHSSFSNIYDSRKESEGAYFIYIDNFNIETVALDKLRVLNKLKLVSNDCDETLRNYPCLNILNLSSRGVFSLPPNTHEYRIELGHYDIFDGMVNMYARPLENSLSTNIVSAPVVFDATRNTLIAHFQNLPSHPADAIKYEYFIPQIS